ncbi:MAG TPA: SDR family NAD(P)-dependent oxidoreductase [Tepidisphaeraceae bacterium]|nr:SDR family NAD(P)-dependent oxidoreductase [Tepidisphaeraceae bacterium]
MVQQNVLDQFRLDGRRALVTGAARGLGKVIATALAQAGADVVVTSRTLGDCQVVADEIARETGRKTHAIAADVSRIGEVAGLFASAQAAIGPLDILVNNAGINIRGPASELSERDWDAVIDVNLKSPFLCAREVIDGMCQREWGRIINLGSIMSVIALPQRAPYASAKAGILGLTRVLALECAGKGVTVNAICPGPFATEMNRPLLDDPEKYNAFVSKVPMGRWGELHEIAGAAVFLASEASSYMTGAMLFIDGGWTAQ